MSKKISELDELLSTNENDTLPIVDTTNPNSLVTKKIKNKNLRKYMLPIEISDVSGLQETLDGKIGQNTIIDGGLF
jgi:hypothetical protein